MISFGVVRRLDQLGRVVLPIELRRTHNINQKDSMEIFVDGENIILKKYAPSCVFCGEAKDVDVFKGKNICRSCREELKNRR